MLFSLSAIGVVPLASTCNLTMQAACMNNESGRVVLFKD